MQKPRKIFFEYPHFINDKTKEKKTGISQSCYVPDTLRILSCRFLRADSSGVLRRREVRWLPKVPCVVRSKPALNPDLAGANALEDVPILLANALRTLDGSNDHLRQLSLAQKIGHIMLSWCPLRVLSGTTPTSPPVSRSRHPPHL